LRQIEERLTKLRSVTSPEKELIDFLEHSFAPSIRELVGVGANFGGEAGLDFDGELPQEWRSLVPSDFGFHNSLRRSDGSLAFVDFEYFGWDDPVKMTADILLHPGRTLPSAPRARFRQAATRLYGADDPAFARRLSAYLPLFGCRWVLIMLNEFIPELWRRRTLAGRLRQLERSQDAATRQSAGFPRGFTGKVHGVGMAVSQATQEIDVTSPSLDERSKYLRRLVVRTLHGGERGHVGSSMSLVEIMRVLYDDILRFRADEPKWRWRDRMILSKGHGCIAQYVMLAEKGFIPYEALDTFCRRDSILGGHPEAAKIPGVEASTGSLGHGLSYGVGMALAARIDKRDSRVIVVMGDGEINEGSVWEAALSAGKHRLSNLTAVVDYNKVQSAGPTT
jgi:transketolase N-terminal domain/subunit